jgi:hypothetical protein
MNASDERKGSDEVQIMPEMIEAGAWELREAMGEGLEQADSQSRLQRVTAGVLRAALSARSSQG